MTNIVERLETVVGSPIAKMAIDEIESLRQQLAECQAQNAKLAERVVGVGEIAINSVSRTALDKMLKQAKREEVLKIADTFEILGGASTLQLRNWAKELE